MKVTIKKLINEDVMKRACEMTFRGSSDSMTLDKIYKCEHSPIRTQMFWIEMSDIPTSASVHMVRHKIGVEHFVLSNREDRGGGKSSEVTRDTLVNHAMLINAQALITMARKRMCSKASAETSKLMSLINDEMYDVDSDLADYLVPECVYRNGLCPELQSCGYNKLIIKV